METQRNVEVVSQRRRWSWDSSGRRVRWVVGCVTMALGVAVAGCGDQSSDMSSEMEQLGTTKAALYRNSWADWEEWSFPSDLGSDPAVCSNTQGAFMVVGSSKTDGTYSAASNWSLVDVTTPWEQVTYGQSTPEPFESAPTCVFEQPWRYRDGNPSDDTFVIAGKGSDNKIYAIRGHQGNAPGAPTFDTDWQQVGTWTFGGANYGRPALGTNGNLVVLAVIEHKTGHSRIDAYTRATPYANHGWSGVKTGPALPSGVTADGVPAITYVRGTSTAPYNKFVLAVRGVSSGTPGLYWTDFDGNNWGSWHHALTGFASVDSDPALEYDDQSDALTVYFRADNFGSIMQGSSHDPYEIGSTGWDFIAHTSPSGVTAPRVVFGGGGDSPPYGIRTVVTRYAQTTSPSGAPSTILWASDHQQSPFYPYEQLNGDHHAACADDALPSGFSARELFDNDVVGCAGSVTWPERASLCGTGSRPCSAAEYRAALGSHTPTHNYWTDDSLRYSGWGGSCSVSTSTGYSCPSDQPMRVCTATGSDTEGNVCNWFNCGYESSSPNEYFGGCYGNTTAGTLCCLAVP